MKINKSLFQIVFLVFWYGLLIAMTSFMSRFIDDLEDNGERILIYAFLSVFYIAPAVPLLKQLLGIVGIDRKAKNQVYFGTVYQVETLCPTGEADKSRCTYRVRAKIILPTKEELEVYSRQYSGTSADCPLIPGDRVIITMNKNGEFLFEENDNHTAPLKCSAPTDEKREIR